MARKEINKPMKFENTKVMNFDGAFRGLRNPLESWSKSDSAYWIGEEIPTYADEVCYEWVHNINPELTWDDDEFHQLFDKYSDWLYGEGKLNDTDNLAAEWFYIGPKDLDLAQRMIKAGSSDRKFLRQILVSVDITAPLYWWKEADTYKVGTTANSTSTMHKLSSTPITKSCFEMDDINWDLPVYNKKQYHQDNKLTDCWIDIIDICETLRIKYHETKDTRYWKELIRILPEGWLQTRTWTANYEILRNMYTQRKTHRLSEWHTFCKWVKSLPYAQELILFNLDNNKKL